jgi:hypothetical protein
MPSCRSGAMLPKDRGPTGKEKQREKQFNKLYHVASEGTMDKIQNCLVKAGVVAFGVVGIVLMVKTIRHRRHAGLGEKVGKNIDDMLMVSMAGLEKATAHVRSAIEGIKSLKS